jgi:hypothetical protein
VSGARRLARGDVSGMLAGKRLSPRRTTARRAVPVRALQAALRSIHADRPATAIATCSGPITSAAGPDYIGGFGTTLAENIGVLGPTLRENEPTLFENSPITSARTHIA